MNKRPINLNLFAFRLPVVGIMSIAHRIAGVILFISMPFIIYGLDFSLSSPAKFQKVTMILMDLRWFLVIFSWALSHHFLAGLRYLFFDLNIGHDAPFYRWSAIAVLTGGIFFTLIIFFLIINFSQSQ